MVKELDKEIAKQCIIDTAKHIVEEEGLQALSARRLSKETGNSLGRMYSYFKNLDELILHVNANTLDRLYDAFTNLSDGKNAIMELAKAYFHFADKNANLWNALIEHRYAEEQTNPEWYQEKVDNIFYYIENKVAEFFPNKNAKQTTLLLWASLHGLWALKANNKFSVVSDEKPEDLLEILVKNIMG